MISALYEERLERKYIKKAPFEDGALPFLYFADTNILQDVPLLNLNAPILMPNKYQVDRNKTYLELLKGIHKNAQIYFPHEEIPDMTDDLVVGLGSRLIEVLNSYNYIYVIGIGGYMANMLFMMDLLYRVGTKVKYRPITQIRCYDGDTITADNICRILIPVYKYTSKGMSMASYFLSDMSSCSTEMMYLPKILQANALEMPITTRGHYCAPTSLPVGTNNTNLFIGSPDLKTRRELFDIGFNFIFFGHHGYQTQMVYRPLPDSDMAVETYGRMDINAFYAGIYMTLLKFLEIEHPILYHDGKIIATFNATRL
jgi:hypothetical protein